MPDIAITCSKCGEVLTISEYASPVSLTCPGCGDSIPPPQAATPKLKPSVKRPEKEAVAEEAAGPVGFEDAETQPGTVTAQVRDGTVVFKKKWLNSSTLTWGIVLLVGVPLAIARYGDGSIIPGGTIQSMAGRAVEFGPWVALAFHVLIAAEAFKDEFFLGICCLAVPGYSLIYFYSRSENHVARVLFTLYAIAFGPETYQGITDVWTHAFRTVNGWITGQKYEAGFEN